MKVMKIKLILKTTQAVCLIETGGVEAVWGAAPRRCDMRGFEVACEA